MTKNKQLSKGFTLVELLIVVAIIGLLATLAVISLTSAQQRSRDTKRVADVKSIQSAMELYYNDNAVYPNITVGGAGASTWTTVSAAMSKYVNALPVDPTNSSTSVYSYYESTATKYYISATVESNSNAKTALLQDIDGTLNVSYDKVTSDITAAAATVSSIDCGVAATDTVYCVGGGQ